MRKGVQHGKYISGSKRTNWKEFFLKTFPDTSWSSCIKAKNYFIPADNFSAYTHLYYQALSVYHIELNSNPIYVGNMPGYKEGISKWQRR